MSIFVFFSIFRAFQTVITFSTGIHLEKTETVAGLCNGDFPSIGLMLLSGLYYRYFCLILCAPLVSLSYYDFG